MAESTPTSFATLYTVTAFPYARAMKTLAAASLNKLTLTTAPDFVFGTSNKEPEFLSKFPHGKIPALETPSGFCISESSAIAHYVADSGPARDQLLGRNVEERALVQMWISFSDLELGVNSGPALSVATQRAEYNSAVVDEKERQFFRALRRLEHHLNNEGKGRKFLVRDDELSLADLSAASSLCWPFMFFVTKKDREEFPKIMAWWEGLMAVEEVAVAYQAPLKMCEERPESLGPRKA